MKLTFLGTRGNIDARTGRHRMHSSMKVSYYETEVVIDCGQDWLGEVEDWERAIFTHLGSEIVEGDEESIGAEIRHMAEERNVDRVEVAYDGMEVVLR